MYSQYIVSSCLHLHLCVTKLLKHLYPLLHGAYFHPYNHVDIIHSRLVHKTNSVVVV